MTSENASAARAKLRRSDYLLFAGLILLGFGGALAVGFFLDDFHILERSIASSWKPSSLAHAFTVFDPDTIDIWCLDNTPTRFFRPLLILSFKLDHALFGFQAAGFHLTNLLLHLLNCCMLAWLLLRLGMARTPTRLAVALFAVFCHNGVAVVWVAGRTELLLATFMLATVLLHVCWLSSRRRLHLALSLVSAGCALLTKESAVALPAYIFGAEWILADANLSPAQRVRAIALRLVPVIALVGAFLIYRFGFFGPHEPPPRPYYFSPSEAGFIAFLAIKTIYYFFAWVTSMPILPVAVIAFLSANPALLALMVAVTVAALVMVVRALRGEPMFWGFLCWLFACQVPVAMVMASSHYLYMGNAAVSVFIALLLTRQGPLTRRRRIITGLIFLLFLGHAAYNVSGYYGLAHTNAAMGDAVAELDGRSDGGSADLYLINLHLTGAHLGQRLRLLHDGGDVHAHLISISSEPFEFGPAPAYAWPDERTLVLSFDQGLIASELIQMLILMGADLTPDRRHRAGPAWVEPRGRDADSIDELIIEFDQPPDGAAIQVLMFRKNPVSGAAEAVSITSTGERVVAM